VPLLRNRPGRGASAIHPSTRRSEKTGRDSPPRSLSGPRRLTTVSYLQLRPFVSHPLHAGFSPVHLTFLSRLRRYSISEFDRGQIEGGDGDVPSRAGDEGRRLGGARRGAFTVGSTCAHLVSGKVGLPDLGVHAVVAYANGEAGGRSTRSLSVGSYEFSGAVGRLNQHDRAQRDPPRASRMRPDRAGVSDGTCDGKGDGEVVGNLSALPRGGARRVPLEVSRTVLTTITGRERWR
jgi:hypothetical protein